METNPEPRTSLPKHQPRGLPGCRPMTAPSGGRNIVRSRPFYNNDLSLDITGDTAGQYTFRSARSRRIRPTTAAPSRERPGSSGRSSTAAQRRRYFFPQDIKMNNSEVKQSPFYSRFDVLLEDQNAPSDSQHALQYDAAQRKHASYYYRDFSQAQLEHFAQNRDLDPLKVDVKELREWLVNAKPRTAMDAAPLFVLSQSLMKSLLEEKSIVFEKRREEEEREQQEAIDALKERVKELELEVATVRKENQVLSNSASSNKEKAREQTEAVLRLQKQLDHGKEVLQMRDHRIKNIDCEIAALIEESSGRMAQADDLRGELGQMIESLGKTLQMLQVSCGVGLEIGVASCNKKTLDELWDQKNEFKVPEAPSTDLTTLKLEQRLASMYEVGCMVAGQLLVKTTDLGIMKAVGGAPVEDILDKSILTARNQVINDRMKILELAALPEPKHPGVIRAALKLLGYPPNKMKKWTDARKLLNGQFIKVLLQLEADSPKTLAALQDAKVELGQITLKEANAGEVGVGSLYSFVHAHIQVQEAKERKAAKEAAERAAREAAAAEAEAEAAAGEGETE